MIAVDTNILREGSIVSGEETEWCEERRGREARGLS